MHPLDNDRFRTWVHERARSIPVKEMVDDEWFFNGVTKAIALSRTEPQPDKRRRNFGRKNLSSYDEDPDNPDGVMWLKARYEEER
jgi:hypothetical protein